MSGRASAAQCSQELSGLGASIPDRTAGSGSHPGEPAVMESPSAATISRHFRVYHRRGHEARNRERHSNPAGRHRLSRASRVAGAASAVMSDVARELSEALEQLRVAKDELRKQNEALVATQLALEGERRRYEELFEIAPIAYLVTDERGTIEAASRLAEDLLGGETRVLAGKPLAEFVPPHERRGIRKLLAQLAHDMHVHDSEFRLIRRDGNDILVRARARAAHGPDGRREVRWSLEDVTKQRQNETE